MSKLPPFDPSKSSPFDESTYQGRLRHFLNVIDPRTLLVSDEQVSKAIELLKNPNRTQVSDEELWNALKIKQAALNPGTNELIPKPFRMSAFLPMNIPIIFGMLSTTSTIGTVFWQVVNASYNSALNYANRSGADCSNVQILQSYMLAVGTSVGLSLGIRALGSRGKMKALLDRAPFVVPYTAVAGSGAANIYATRRVEITEGISITDENGNRLGMSQEAGKQAVMKTILTRAIGLPLPVLVLPPLILKTLPTVSHPQGKIALELVVIAMSLAGALPATVAIYPQTIALDVNSLEPEFRNLVNSSGEIIKTVYANKGL